MKIHELINELKVLDGEFEVHFQYNYGDHWRTQVAPDVKSVEVGRVTYSAYHSMPKVLDEDDKDYDKAPEVVLLSD